MLFSFIISISKWDFSKGFKGIKIVGFSNYIEIWRDAWFRASLINNIVFTVSYVVILIVLSFIVAYLLNEYVVGKKFVQLGLYLPYIVNIVAISAVWLALFSNNGPILNLLRKLGMSNPPVFISDLHCRHYADRLRAEEGQSPVNIWEMTEGCICCSAKGDFSLSVLSIANTIDPEYLVIEPTGVGMLGNVLENVKKIEYQRISILSPVTIADIYSCRRYLKEYPALYENQIREAGTIFLSKSEQASPEEKEEARQILTGINPTATIYTDHYSSLPEKDWLRILETGYDGQIYESKAAESEELPDTFSIENAYFASPESLLIFLEDLIRGKYGKYIPGKRPASCRFLLVPV